jgi:hypothetical protein
MKEKSNFTDAELTKIYCDANGIGEGKRPPITTQRIFTAMRAMEEAIAEKTKSPDQR